MPGVRCAKRLVDVRAQGNDAGLGQIGRTFGHVLDHPTAIDFESRLNELRPSELRSIELQPDKHRRSVAVRERIHVHHDPTSPAADKYNDNDRPGTLCVR